MGKRIKIRYPVYLEEFKCVGGSCEDNCCGEWTINIDKSTFEQYKNVQELEIKNYITENIIIKENCNSPSVDYARIKLKDGGSCPFLGENNYCIIQSNLGEKYLSEVCTTYPRIINKLDDCYEISLNVSCLEAAKILLLKEDGIKFKESENTLEKFALATQINTKSKEIADTNFRYIKELRSVAINIIQNRKYEISERLYIVGAFLEGARKELCYDYNNVSEFINKYNIEFFKGKFKRNKEDYMLQLSFYKEIMERIKITDGKCSSYFEEKLCETMQGFRFNEHESLAENSKLYLQAFDICEKDIFNKYSYIFENYLVNHMFKELFPFSESDVIINDYMMMLVRFSYIRFFIIGQYLYGDKILKKDAIIRTIQVISKEIEHNQTYLKDILKFLKENELDTIRFARILL